jgi:hypothetical protein
VAPLATVGGVAIGLGVLMLLAAGAITRRAGRHRSPH